MPPVPPFQLTTLGRLALLDADGRDIVPRDVAKPLALLAYLAAIPGRRCSRERLVDLFWGDSALEQGRASLRQVIYRLRDLLGDELIRSESAELQLAPELRTDREAFLCALERGEIDAALSLYGGMYIADFVSRGTTHFEQWRDQEQDRLHELFTNAAEVVGQQALAAGRAQEAAALAQRVLRNQPLDERGWRLRLQAEQLAGSSIHLDASITEFRRLLSAEGWKPQARTLQLIHALERARTPPDVTDRHASLDTDLIGRGQVMAKLYQSWRQVTRRNGTHLHLVGGAGLGKSRMLEDFAVRLRAERGRVVMVGAYPRQRSIPDTMLASVIAALAELPAANSISAESARILIELQPTVSPHFPAATPLASAGGQPRTAAIGEAFRDLLEGVSSDGALCLLLDDAHWWDDESRHTLEATIERLVHHPILVVSASRPGDGEIATGLTRERIELSRWHHDDVLALVQSLGSTEDAAATVDLASALCDAAEGVPLLVIEALRLGLDRKVITLRERQWTFSGLREFETMLRPGQLLRERASTLTCQQRHLLLVAWLLEAEVQHDDWHTIDADSHGGTAVELERLGFLTSSRLGWKLGHDAIGEAIEAVASAEALKSAHRDAGLLSLQHGDHPITLQQAARHGIESGDRSVQQQVALRWVGQRRAQGATSSTAHLVSEVFPDDVARATLRALARDLPSDLRHRPWSARRLAPIWAVAGAAVVLGAWWATTQPPAPGVVLALYALDVDSTGLERHLPLDHSTWGTTEPLTTAPTEQNRWRWTSFDSLSTPPMVDPSGSRWLFSRTTSGDGGPTELALIEGGVERILAPARGDDIAPSWAPDGRSAVVQSTRWSARSAPNFDLGIVDLQTLAIRQLTSDAGEEEMPRWSPDGVRIAYVQRPITLAPESICWISIDGARGACRTVGTEGIVGLLGWLDPHTVVLETRAGAHCAVELVDIDEGTRRPLHAGSDCTGSLSPDGTWLIWGKRPTGASRSRTVRLVTSMTGMFDTHPLRYSDVGVYWRGRWNRDFIERVTIGPAGDTIYRSASYQLQLSGLDGQGRIVGDVPSVAAYQSSDTVVATVDSAGVIRPQRSGAVVITGTFGGWRTTSTRFIVARAEAQIVFEEQWSGGWEKRWVRWGVPDPKLGVGPTGKAIPALLVNGDVEYDSGAYSEARFDPVRGVALEVRVSTPITQIKWQVLKLGFSAVDRLSRSGPVGGGGCKLNYPSEQTWQGAKSMGTPGGQIPVDAALATGAWNTIRLQVFPDRTCGVAINGVPISRSQTAIASRDSLAITLAGQTVAAALLVGPLKVWTGVPTDIDWVALRHAEKPL